MKYSLLSVLAFTLMFVSCKRGEPVDLKMNLQPGSQYLYTMDQRMVTEQTAMGQTVKMINSMLMESTYDVKAAEGVNKRITVTYDRIAISADNPRAHVQFDSKDTAAGDTVLKGLTGMLNKPFTMIVSPGGEVLKIEGLNEILGGLQGTAQAQLGNMFNDSAVRSMMQQSLNIFPDQPVRIGETWRKSYQYDMSVLGMKVDNEYTLKSVTNGVAKIDVKSKISGGGAMSGNDPMQNMKMDLKGEQTGTLEVEVATGLITDGKMEQDVKGTLSMMTMTVPVTMKQQVHITAKKK
jgi:hypothetical protein